MPPDQIAPPLAQLPSTALFDRYRDPALAGRVPYGPPLLEAILGHRSVRAYRTDPLPGDVLPSLVAAAQSAPTSSNLQAWSVLAVQDQGRRDRLAALAANQRHIGQAPLFLVWLADLSRAERMAAAQGRVLDGLPYLEALLVAVIDAALAAQNATVAADAMGLGTVYIGALRNHPEAVAAELGLPPQVMAVFGLCVGVPDPARPAAVKPRLPQSAVLHHEQYDPADSGGIAAYDERLRAFQDEQAMPTQGWTPLVMNRLGSVKSLAGRDRMVAALQAMGFGLK